MQKQIVSDELAAAYRQLGYEINMTHMGAVSADDVRFLLRSVYEKRARMNKLIDDVEHLLNAMPAIQ